VGPAIGETAEIPGAAPKVLRPVPVATEALEAAWVLQILAVTEEEDEDEEERALEATDRTEELSEDTEDAFCEVPVREPRTLRLISSFGLKRRRGEAGL
jgi:hypothetical protein